MYKFLLVAVFCVFFSAGCAGNSDVQPTNPELGDAKGQPSQEMAKEEVSQSKAKPQSSKNTRHVAKSPDMIKADLDATARQLLQRASHTITPSKANKSVRLSGNEYVATYIEINPNNFSTEMRPASKSGTYNGFIRYSEQVFHCKGKTKSAALSAPCSPVTSRRMNEMVHYDGTKWNY